MVIWDALTIVWCHCNHNCRHCISFQETIGTQALINGNDRTRTMAKSCPFNIGKIMVCTYAMCLTRHWNFSMCRIISKKLKYVLPLPQIVKTVGSTSIRNRSDAKVCDRCQSDGLCYLGRVTPLRRNGPLTRYAKLWLRMRRECRERFPCHRLQRTPLVSDPGMHHGNGTCVTDVPWCMSGSLTWGGGENVAGIPGACATRNFTYLARGPRRSHLKFILLKSNGEPASHAQ